MNKIIVVMQSIESGIYIERGEIPIYATFQYCEKWETIQDRARITRIRYNIHCNLTFLYLLLEWSREIASRRFTHKWLMRHIMHTYTKKKRKYIRHLRYKIFYLGKKRIWKTYLGHLYKSSCSTRVLKRKSVWKLIERVQGVSGDISR